MPKLKVGTITPPPDEDAAIAADPCELSSEQIAQMRPPRRRFASARPKQEQP